MGIIKRNQLAYEPSEETPSKKPTLSQPPVGTETGVIRGVPEKSLRTLKLDQVHIEPELSMPIPLIAEEGRSEEDDFDMAYGSDDEQLSLTSAIGPDDPLGDLEATDALTPTEAPSGPTQAELDAATKLAREEAYKEGLEEGEREAQVHAQSLLDALNTLSEKKNAVIEGAEEQVLELALDIAKKVTQKEIQLDPSILHDIVKDALARVVSSDKVIIRANKEDIDGLQSQMTAFQSALHQVGSVTIQEDANQIPGGCIIETDFGYIDVSVATKLYMIKKVLMSAYHKNN